MGTGFSSDGIALDRLTGLSEYHLHNIPALRSDVDEGLVVARRNNKVLDAACFRARVDAWMRYFRRESPRSIALYEEDAFEFAAILFGAWCTGVQVCLPGDLTAEIINDLSSQSALFVGSFPEGVECAPSPEDGGRGPIDARVDLEGELLVLYTSGSTGAPQPIVKQLFQIFSELYCLECAFGIDIEGSQFLRTVSHQHIYGLLFGVLWPLSTGRCFYADRVVWPETMLDECTNKNVAIVSGPAHLRRLPDRGSRSVQTAVVFSSGGPLPLNVVPVVERVLGSTPTEVYGSSETGGIAYRRRLAGNEKPWSLLPGVEIRLSGDVYEIMSGHVSGKTWCEIPDRIEIVSGSEFNVLGRHDRILKLEGKRISPLSIENSLMASGFMDEVRVVLLSQGREELGVVARLSAEGWKRIHEHGVDALRSECSRIVRPLLPSFARPRRWRWVSEMPVNDNGKMSATSLAELFEMKSLAEPAIHVLSVSSDSLNALVYVSSQLQCFDGHFEGEPVLPGVVQLDWSIEYARKYLGVKGSFSYLEAVKFQRLCKPENVLTLELRWKTQKRQLSFKFHSENGVHSSGRIYFSAE